MSLKEKFLETLVEYNDASPERREAADKAHQLSYITYHIDKHLASVDPSFPAEERYKHAKKIAAKINGADVVTACLKWSQQIKTKVQREYEDGIVVDAIKRHMLDESYSLNDVGNGERFAVLHHNKLRYLHDRNIWMRWDSKRWRESTKGELIDDAKAVAKQNLKEVLKRTDEKKDDLIKWARSSFSYRNLTNMIACALGERVFSAKMSDFDQQQHLLTVENGTIDLRDGSLHPHRQEDMLTSLTSINYDPTATCPRWNRFIMEIFGDNVELASFVQRAVGYSMTGHTEEHAFFILHGSGRNGKGRFVKQLDALLGDAAKTTRFQTFTVNRDNENGNTPALAALVGARLVSAGEPDRGVRLSESIIKMLTGEDEITVCNKYERPFSYTPRYKIWLHCNYKPQIRGTDMGIWSRPRLIPFNTSFVTLADAENDKSINLAKRKDPDRKLDVTLDSERSGILSWAVRGAVLWFAEGLGNCKIVDNATTTYRTDSDDIGQFINECVNSEPANKKAFVSNDDMYRAYTLWAEFNTADRPLKKQILSKELIIRGLRSCKKGNVRGFFAIEVTKPNYNGTVRGDKDKDKEEPIVEIDGDGQPLHTVTDYQS